MALPSTIKQPDLLQRTSILSKRKTSDSGGPVRTRFAKPRPNIKALSSKTAANVTLPKQVKLESKEKDEKGSEDVKDSMPPCVEKADGFNVSGKNETLSTSNTTDVIQQKDICKGSSSDLPRNSFPEEDLLEDATPCVESMEATVTSQAAHLKDNCEFSSSDLLINSSVEMQEDEKVKERCVEESTSSIDDMHFRSKRHYETAFQKQILSTVEVSKTSDSLAANLLNSPEKIIVSEKIIKPRKKFATARLISSSSDSDTDCESVPNRVNEVTSVPRSTDDDEESIDDPLSCVTTEGVANKYPENHKGATGNENPPAVVNDTNECSPLKNIQNSPRKRKTRKRKKRISKAKTALPRSEMKMVDLIDYIPDGAPMKYTNSQTTVGEEDGANENSVPVEEKEDSSVPRVVIGENGEIIVDESSLLIRRKESSFNNTSAEVENDNTTYTSFRKKLSKKWNFRETLKFYKALTIVGTDFALMEIIFKNDFKITKSRHELKLKFKLEERHNPKFIYKAMYESEMWDIQLLQTDSDNIIDSSDIEDEPSISKSNTQLDDIDNMEKDRGKECNSTEGALNDDQMVL